jgi:hypothetical protein
VFFNRIWTGKEARLARSHYSFEKRRREVAKKKKKEEKRQRRLDKGNPPSVENADAPPAGNVDVASAEGEAVPPQQWDSGLLDSCEAVQSLAGHEEAVGPFITASTARNRWSRRGGHWSARTGVMGQLHEQPHPPRETTQEPVMIVIQNTVWGGPETAPFYVAAPLWNRAAGRLFERLLLPQAVQGEDGDHTQALPPIHALTGTDFDPGTVLHRLMGSVVARFRRGRFGRSAGRVAEWAEISEIGLDFQARSGVE